ncbi:MAG: acyltransferase [Betaproteobacteria bacterium]|nr:acyltransferase [Betaproteobacteria bacterium]
MPNLFPRFANRFDVLRLALASLVIVSHVPELSDGNRSREILTGLFHTLSLGKVAVDGFFLVSGYLILQSWLREPRLLRFLQKRVLRIYPAFLAASLVCVLIVGPIAGSPSYWHTLDASHAVTATLTLQVPAVPAAFQGMAYPMVNGAMWTVHYEFACYLLVALMGLALRRSLTPAWMLLTLALSAFYGYVQLSTGPCTGACTHRARSWFGLRFAWPCCSPPAEPCTCCATNCRGTGSRRCSRCWRYCWAFRARRLRNGLSRYVGASF